ncbi:MAG TPA: hypothetical protein PLK94_03845 [Alphaproteobacteria bacterium]|nr:hypothetical protein [Alphaproteobacteria bacterium]HOO50404.1 hypothetical protein [Alphaproteobacteria bacterium]
MAYRHDDEWYGLPDEKKLESWVGISDNQEEDGEDDDQVSDARVIADIFGILTLIGGGLALLGAIHSGRVQSEPPKKSVVVINSQSVPQDTSEMPSGKKIPKARDAKVAIKQGVEALKTTLDEAGTKIASISVAVGEAFKATEKPEEFAGPPSPFEEGPPAPTLPQLQPIP